MKNCRAGKGYLPSLRGTVRVLGNFETRISIIGFSHGPMAE